MRARAHSRDKSTEEWRRGVSFTIQEHGLWWRRESDPRALIQQFALHVRKDGRANAEEAKLNEGSARLPIQALECWPPGEPLRL